MRRIAFSRADQVARLRQRLKKQRRLLPLFERQILIARTQRQAVRLANDGADPYRHGQVEIVHHLLNDARLLEILLAKVSDFWLNDLQQLQTDGGPAAKMPRPR